MRKGAISLVVLGFLFFAPPLLASQEEVFATKATVPLVGLDSVDNALDMFSQTVALANKEQFCQDLYALLGEDLRELVSADGFCQAVTETGMEVVRREIVRENEEFAETRVRLQTSAGERDFTVFFKKEDGRWRIFGTE